MTIVKVMDPVDSSSVAIHLPPEVGINQVVESDKVRNSTRWQYLTEFILYVIKAPKGGTQEIPTPQNTSETNHNPRGAPISVPVESAPGFGESSG